MLQQVDAWIKAHISPLETRANDASEEMTGDKVPQAVVILDEVLHAVKYGLVAQDALIRLLRAYRSRAEFVLTGRDPSAELLARADYVTEMKKQRHPYDKGVFARKGIEL